MIRRPPRSTPLYSSAASDVYKRQGRVALVAQRPIVIKLSRGRSVDWSVCRSVCPVHCGKTADRIRMPMPFGIVGRAGPGMRPVVGFGNRSTRRGTFGGTFGARHCNQWGLYGVRVRQRRDAALFPNYFGQTCFIILQTTRRTRNWLKPRHVPVAYVICNTMQYYSNHSNPLAPTFSQPILSQTTQIVMQPHTTDIKIHRWY